MLGRGRAVDLVALGVLALVAVVIGVLSLTRGVEGVDMDTKNTRLPAQPPLEWQADGLWKSPVLLPKAGRVLVVGQDKVAMLTHDRKVVLVDAASGDTVWAETVPDGEIKTSLANTRIGGKDVVAAQFGDVLAWWGRDDGEAGEVALPAGTTITYAGTTPLGRARDGSIGAVSPAGIQKVAVPGGAVALAAREDGTVTAASPKGWWHLTPGRPAGPVTGWQTTGRPGTVTVVGYMGSTIITTVTKPNPAVVMQADRPTDVRYLFEGRYVPAKKADAVTWSPSPARTWGILGRSLIDLSAGTVTDLGAWKTDLVAEDRALGTIGEQAVLVGPAIPRGVLQDREGFPEGILPAGAVVRARDQGGEVVHMLPPARR